MGDLKSAVFNQQVRDTYATRRQYGDYPVAVDFNDEKHDVSTLPFCGIEKDGLPPRGGDPDLFFVFFLKTWGLLDLHLTVVLLEQPTAHKSQTSANEFMFSWRIWR